MKPVSFDYVRAESVDEVLGVLRERGGEARILAGGQSLLPMLNMRLARPRVVVDIMRIRPLAVTAFERSLRASCCFPCTRLIHARLPNAGDGSDIFPSIS